MILIGCPKCKPPIMIEIYDTDKNEFLKHCDFCNSNFKFSRFDNQPTIIEELSL